MDTGPASSNNCGPSCVSMLYKYCHGRDLDVQEVRDCNSSGNDWWYTSHISYSLNGYGISNAVHPLSSDRALFQALSRGSLVVACLDMSRVSEQEEIPETRYNRYYKNVTGHFLILKGYTDKQEWLIAYDSNNWRDHYYSDKTPKGKNRFYKTEEVLASMREWWPYFFEVVPTDLLAARGVPEERVPMKSSLDDIPDAWGR